MRLLHKIWSFLTRYSVGPNNSLRFVEAIEPARQKPTPAEIWLHVPTLTIAYVEGDFGQFKLNGRLEESYWGLFREDTGHGWVKIGDA